MKKSTFAIFGSLMFLISGCSNFSSWWSSKSCLDSRADRLEERLKRYFTNGRNTGEDVSTLISESRAISAKLKAVGKKERANKFDSYVDVLMYGNKTIDESIRDVQDLVRDEDGSKQEDSKVCKFLNKVFP